jgi:hypothetical protein
MLFGGLRQVVRRPVLLVGLLLGEDQGSGFSDGAIGTEFTLDGELDSIQVFALVTILVVGARPRKDPKFRMGTDIRIPMTEDQKRLIAQATSDEPDGMAAWARAILLEAATKKLDKKAKKP